MPMSRTGLSSLMGYQEGGDPSSPTTGTPTGLDALASLMTPKTFDFDASVEKYEDRLSPFINQQPPVTGYEAASLVGSNILAQQAEKFPSLGRGVGMGFQALSAEIKKRRESKRKEKQAVAMKAIEMASEDEQSAKKFLNDYSLKLIDLANKEIPRVTLQYQDESGEKIEQTFYHNDPQVSAILANGGVEIKSPQSVTNIDMGNASDLDKERAKNIAKTEQTWQVEADGATGVRDQILYARSVAEELGPDGFGPVEQFTAPIRTALVDLGFGNIIDISKLSDQQLLGQLGTSFAMALVGKTKGAISNREMDMFLRASPTLGATYEGFMKMLTYLDRIAERSEKFNEQWNQKSIELAKANASIAEIQGALASFKSEFRGANPLFDEQEFAELESIKDDKNYSEVNKGYTSVTAQRAVNNQLNDRASKIIEDIENDDSLSATQKAQKIREIQNILGT
tara:strand:- start:6511 stop:7875 length:1365 start_codon:yes stop_codon:yes gene_type:complete